MKACTLFTSDNEVAEDWLGKFNSREPLDIYGQKYLIDEISTDYEHGFAGVTIKMYPAYQAKSPERPKKQEAWDGEGLPPVGIECEWHPNVHGWVKVKILGRDGADTWYRASGEEHSQTCRNMAFFRPIRTDEKVAAEEKIAAIAEMRAVVIAASERKSATIAECIATVALYEAGYRKQ